MFAHHLLIMDRQRIMTGVGKRLGSFARKVFVQLKTHYAAPGENGTMRSRANSAAYAIEASMSSLVTDG